MTGIDTEKLDALIRAYYNLTKIRVAVYNTEFEEILAYPREYTPFCRMVNDEPCACKACEDSAARMCEKCTATHETIIEKCHMGLTELVTPLRSGAAVIGYIMLGQITSEADRDAFVRGVLKKSVEYGLDRSSVLEKVSMVPCYSMEQVLDSARVVKALASYIVVSNLVYPTETLLAQSVMEYITQHLAEDVSVPVLCREFSVSKATLYRATRLYAPDGIASYVRKLRCSKACELLRHSNLTVSDIAEQVGYSDTAYFLRSFKKEKGISAGNYRTQKE